MAFARGIRLAPYQVQKRINGRGRQLTMTQMLQINRTHSLTRLRWLKGDPRRAIGDDAIVCLVCGYALRQLTNTHLRLHGLTAPVYRERFGYNRCRPLMAHALRRAYAERAVRNGLALRIRVRPIVSRPELRRQGGARTIALEERLTRRDARARSMGAVR